MFKGNVTDDFKTLIHSLNLESNFDDAQYLIVGHLRLVQNLLGEFLATDSLVDSSLRQALYSLAQDGVLRLLSSPYICEMLMIAKARATDDPAGVVAVKSQLLKSLVAEVRLLDPEFQHPVKATWTANGDVVLDPKIAAQYPAVQTTCGISLNYQSYAHNTGRAGIGGYDLQTAIKHKERIETGREIVRFVSASANSLIETFTTVIQFRQNQLRPNVVNSSTHTSIGLIRCDNFHKLHTDMPEIVDMLVHESIHQYLHLFEEQLFDFVNLEVLPQSILDQCLFASPWSGNLLDIRSYTHAILVWHGLVGFWQKFLDSGYIHNEVTRNHAQTKLNEALYGFLKSPSVLDNLKEAKQYLNADYVAQVQSLQKQFKVRLGA